MIQLMRQIRLFTHRALRTVCILLIPVSSFCQTPQKISGKLSFFQGQSLQVELQVKTTIAQQIMGQAIDFNIDATANHSYTVTNTTDDNSTLHHDINRIRFSFDGMGNKMNFDSNEDKDINGRFGTPIKEILTKKYDIIVDPTGLVLMAIPEKIELADADNQAALLMTMLSDVKDLVQPPQKGKPSFFKILPDKEVGKGDTWTDSFTDDRGKTDIAYILTEINDTTIVIDYVSSSATITKSVMAGNDVTTKLSNKTTGKIFLHRNTGILKEKTINTESNGIAETASFGNLPVTSKTTGTIKVVNKP
jgi:Family of unknown function (DUF6263)